MTSAEKNRQSDTSERENLHLLFYAAIRFLLDLLGLHGKTMTELILMDSGERCDITIDFDSEPYPSAGIFRTWKKHVLIEFKSHHYPLDEKALVQAVNYANFRAFGLAEEKQMSGEITLPIFGFRMRNWFRKAVAEKYELEKVEAGIYDVRRYTRHMLSLILIDELIGDEYVCLKLLGENPTLDYCGVMLEQIGILRKQGKEEAVSRGERILSHVFRKHPEILEELRKQGGSQMAYSEFTQMYVREADRNVRLETENFGLKQSVTEKDNTISELKESVSGLESENSDLKQSVSEMGNLIDFLKQQISGFDLEALAGKAKQKGLNAKLLL